MDECYDYNKKIFIETIYSAANEISENEDIDEVRYGSGCCTPHYTHETYTFGLF